GSVLTQLDPDQLDRVILEIAALAAEPVAVCFLFSFANPSHEQAVARALGQIKIPVSLSSTILPEYREYERTSTVVINSYLAPLMSNYLRSLERELASAIRHGGRLAGRESRANKAGRPQ